MNTHDCITIPLTKITEISERNIDLLEFFNYPAILGIHCFAENSTYFFHTSNCWLSMCAISDDLVFQRTIGCTQLSYARSNYGLESLAVIIFKIGPKWEKSEKRAEKMQLLKQTWQHNIY